VSAASVIPRVAARWNGYWFASGGRYSIAVLRIAVAVSVWMSLDQMAATWVDIPSYRPIGLWMLAGGSAPASGLVSVLWIVARVATVAMLVGAFSRVTTAASFVATTLIASLHFSGMPSWSHAYNVVLLAQLALIGARCGDALAIDALIRRRRGDAPHGYQWSLRLAQIAIALMFASGMFHKVRHGGLSLDWALSDNLRNQLVVHFDAMGLPRTAVANWIIDDVWRFRATALGNLIMQLVPLAACFLVRRPVLRALCGACFVVEILGLGFVMDLWDWQWLPLTVVFVDWEWLFRVKHAGAPAELETGRSRRALSGFIAAFLALDVLASFVPRLDQRMNLYPFTGFPMFASIRSPKPYHQHATYSFESGHIELVSTEVVPPEIEDELDRYYAKYFRVRDRDQLRTRLSAIMASARRMHPPTTALRVYYTINEVPAYPAPARVDRRVIALLGELSVDGSFRSLLGAARNEGADIVLAPGEPVTGVVSYYADEVATAHPLPGLRAARPVGRKVAYVLDDGKQRWLVYQARR
jgi:hypothetical protein